jgi:hypothetical protein
MDGASGMGKSNGGLGAVDRHSFDIVSWDQSKIEPTVLSY